MTFDDDMILLQTDTGPCHVTCKNLGIEWPPPEVLNIAGVGYERLRYSAIPDSVRANMGNVFRGAEYIPLRAVGSIQ